MDRDRQIIAYCRSGHRSIAAAITLCELRFKDVHSLEGRWLSGINRIVRHRERNHFLLDYQYRDVKMPDELIELLQTAMYKEIASQAFYIAGQNKSDDPMVKELMKELAGEESRHLQMLQELKDKEWRDGQWHKEKIPNLMMSEYLVGGDTLEGAGFQETLLFAMKQKQKSVELYSRMMRDEYFPLGRC